MFLDVIAEDGAIGCAQVAHGVNVALWEVAVLGRTRWVVLALGLGIVGLVTGAVTLGSHRSPVSSSGDEGGGRADDGVGVDADEDAVGADARRAQEQEQTSARWKATAAKAIANARLAWSLGNELSAPWWTRSSVWRG